LQYSIDTSALLDAWIRWYPPDIFSKLWINVDELIASGNLFASEEVLVELEKKMMPSIHGRRKESTSLNQFQRKFRKQSQIS
jgi:hypothetical protein